MKVLVIADPIVPVPPVMYGGSERIVDLMCRGLIRRGHEVGLMAGPGSHLETEPEGAPIEAPCTKASGLAQISAPSGAAPIARSR